MASLTTFVVGNGPVSMGVLTLIESWTRAGILEPSLWVTPLDITEHAAGPPTVTATHIHAGGAETVDLFEYIGRFRLDIVRIVAAHVVVHDGEVDEALTLAARLVAHAVNEALPRRVDTSLQGGCRLHRSVLVIPVTGASGANRGVIEPEWEVNAVISPEDRPDLDRASIFVRHPGNFQGHAAAALAAVGGILQGVGVGVLDDLASDSTTSEAGVVVARISIRSVVGEDVLDEVAARALDMDKLPAGGPGAVLSWARPAADPATYARNAAQDILNSPEWVPTALPSQPRSSQHHQRFWSALATAARFNVKTVGAVASWALSRGRATIEQNATEAIVGSAAGILVTLGPRPVDDLTRTSSRILQQERSRIDEEVRMDANRVAAPTPETWSRLRALSLGLLDGGDLDGFPEPRQAGKRELLTADSIVARPDDEWTTSDGLKVGADDPQRMREYLNLVTFRQTAAQQAFAAAALKVKAARAARAEKDRQTALAASKGTDAGTGAKAAAEASAAPASADGATADTDDDTGTLQEAEEAEAVAKSAAAAARSEAEAYTAWFQFRTSSLLWLVGDDIARRTSQLGELQTKAANRTTPDAPPADALKAAQRRLMLWWAWITPIWLVASVIVLFATFGPFADGEAPLSIEQMIYWLVGVFALFALILIAANHRFYKAVRRYEAALARLLDQLRREQVAFVYASKEKARLEILADALRDWVRILGEVVHRPWAPTANQYDELPDEIIAALPAAMGLARQPSGDRGVPPHVILEAYDFAYPRGWSSRQFDMAYEAWEGETSSTPQEGYRSVDLDTLASATSPRRRLLEFWTSGEARSVLTTLAAADLRAVAESGQLELPDRVVGRIGRYSDGETGSERSFFEVMATESTTFAIDMFTATARHGRGHYVERSIAWMPASVRGRTVAEGVEIRGCTGSTAVRVDLSRRTPAAELLPFASDRDVAGAGFGLPLASELEDAAQADVSWH